ncbi:MAG: DMT family transporter [Planctomycetota bacterium]
MTFGIGESAALAAAMMWAVSAMIWGRVELTAVGINLTKNVFGTVYILIHLAIVSVIAGTAMFNASLESLGWLSLSGLVGIVIGDTLYFRSLQILGPRLSLMVASSSPLAAALLGWWWLSEDLMWFSIVGIMLTVAGIVSVVSDRRAKAERPKLLPGKVSTGVLCGIGGAIAQAAGVALSKLGMDDCGPAEATFVRLVAAAVLTVVITMAAGNLRSIVRNTCKAKTLKLILLGTAVGTWLGIWLSQVAVKDTNVAIAQTLLATSPLFAIPIVFFYQGHKVSVIAIIGTLIAIFGIFLAVSSNGTQ